MRVLFAIEGAEAVDIKQPSPFQLVLCRVMIFAFLGVVVLVPCGKIS